MKKADRIAGILILALSLYIIMVSLRLKLWENDAPAPGFVPFWVGLFLGISSLMLIFSTYGKKYKAEVNVLSLEGIKTLLFVSGSVLIALLFVNMLGMVITMGLLSGFLVAVFDEKKNWPIALGTLIILPLIFYWIFKIALKVPLPKGIFGI